MKSVPSTMAAVVLTGHGGLDKLVYHQDFPVPDLASGEVLIEVTACGLNNTDVWVRQGAYGTDENPDAVASWRRSASEETLTFPRVQGTDSVGKIVRVGSDVSAERLGERVMVDFSIYNDDGDSLAEIDYIGHGRDGGFAEYLAVPDENAHVADNDLTDAELATFCCAYLTGEHMLDRAQVRAGERVFITGASGGVGSGLIQLCRARGAIPYALTSKAKLEAVKAIGAEAVIDRASPDLIDASHHALKGHAVDVVADLKADQAVRTDAFNAAATKAEFDISYGPHPRERLDLFLPDSENPPLFVYIHGGYWQWGDKELYSFMAEQLVPGGAAYANIEYELCPNISLTELTDQIRRALAYLWREAGRLGYDRDRIVVSGHSAGGHLTAMMMATDWPRFDAQSPALPVDLVKGGCGISGLYDLEPIRLCFLNQELKLDPEAVARNSPLALAPRGPGTLLLAVGSEEGPEYRRQSEDLAAAWRRHGIAVEVLVLAGQNHFTIVEQLGDPLRLRHEICVTYDDGHGVVGAHFARGHRSENIFGREDPDHVIGGPLVDRETGVRVLGIDL